MVLPLAGISGEADFPAPHTDASSKSTKVAAAELNEPVESPTAMAGVSMTAISSMVLPGLEAMPECVGKGPPTKYTYANL